MKSIAQEDIKLFAGTGKLIAAREEILVAAKAGIKLIAQESIKMVAAGEAKLIAVSDKLVAVGILGVLPSLPLGYGYVVDHEGNFVVDEEGRYVYAKL